MTAATCSRSSCRCRPGSIPAARPVGRSSASCGRSWRRCPASRRWGCVSQLPLTGSGPLSPFAYNEETARNFESVTADGRNVSPEYFEAMDAKLLAGRTFTYQDSIGTPPVIIVDETLAKLAWPGQNAVGKQLQLAPTGDPNAFSEVVGVVEPMRQHDLTRDILHQIYYPIGQGTPTNMTFVVETTLDPASLIPTVRRTVNEMDPDLPLSRLTPMSTYLTEGQAHARFSLVLMSVLGRWRCCSPRWACSGSFPTRSASAPASSASGWRWARIRGTPASTW